jgi:hypothetical protein
LHKPSFWSSAIVHHFDESSLAVSMSRCDVRCVLFSTACSTNTASANLAA